MLQRVLKPRFRPFQCPFFTVQRRHLRPSTTAQSLTMPHPAVKFIDPATPLPPSNKHVSVNPEGITLIDLEFIEEPLGVTAEQGHGFIRIEFGEAIGPDNRYEVVRKLGWGMNSSVWMAFDSKYVLDESRPHIILIISAGKRDTSLSKL